MTFNEHLEKYLSKDEIEKLNESLKQEDKHAALLNLHKMDDETFMSLYPHVSKHPIVPHAYYYDKNEYELGKSIYHLLGAYYLQEPSAMLPSFYLSPKPGDYVLDLCAAPGGKSVQASLLMQNKGTIISNDISSSRISAIRDNAERLGLCNLVITNNDFSKIYQNYLNYFDKIILDAPCSGSGMFRKLDTMEDDWSYNKVLKFAELQKELLSMAYAMLKPGGIISYSTCSFSYEEDEEVIEYLLNNTDAKIMDLPNNDLFYKSKSNIGIHTLPYLFPGEGHYLCLIKKPGEIIPYKEEIFDNHQYEKSFNLHLDNLHIVNFGDSLFALPTDIKVKGLNIIRYGMKIGEINHQLLKFDNHYVHYLNSFDNEYELKEEELQSYLKGNVISTATKSGWILVKYHNISLDIGKSDSRIIKNHLPKYIRSLNVK